MRSLKKLNKKKKLSKKYKKCFGTETTPLIKSLTDKTHILINKELYKLRTIYVTFMIDLLKNNNVTDIPFYFPKWEYGPLTKKSAKEITEKAKKETKTTIDTKNVKYEPLTSNELINAYKIISKASDDKDNKVTYRFGIPNKDTPINIEGIVDTLKDKDKDKDKDCIILCLLTENLSPENKTVQQIKKYNNLDTNKKCNFIFLQLDQGNPYLIPTSLGIKNPTDTCNEIIKIICKHMSLWDIIYYGNMDVFLKIIADITKYKYFNDFILGYHCKSGKDRTSVCDAIVQATFFYIRKQKKINKEYEFTPEDYKTIKQYALSFLYYGYFILFYNYGLLGFKFSTGMNFFNDVQIKKNDQKNDDYYISTTAPEVIQNFQHDSSFLKS